jgi:hypothetical protein
MGINFQIFATKLAGQTRYVARISQKDNYDQTMLVDRMVEMGTSVSRGDIESVLGLFQKAVERICGEGSTASLDGFVRFAPAIGGAFDSEADGYLSPRNSVYVNASVSSVFNNRFAVNTGVEKVSSSFKSPRLFSVDDLASETTNEKVTPINIVSLGGERLKFEPQSSLEYLRFVNAEDPAQFVPITKFQKFTDKEVVFLMPAVPFAKGYFELANAMNTARVRSDKSVAVDVAA